MAPPRGRKTLEADGRTLRSERSRERIAEAIYELVREHGRQPTALQIAKRAGVSPRTLFRHAGDMESLRGAVSARVEADVRARVAGSVFEGTLDERIRALVRQRIRLFEEIAPFARITATAPDSSPVVDRRQAALHGLLREQIAAALGEALAPAGRDALESLDAILSFEHWDRLTRLQGLGRTRVARILESAVLALVSGRASRRSS